MSTARRGPSFGSQQQLRLDLPLDASTLQFWLQQATSGMNRRPLHSGRPLRRPHHSHETWRHPQLRPQIEATPEPLSGFLHGPSPLAWRWPSRGGCRDWWTHRQFQLLCSRHHLCAVTSGHFGSVHCCVMCQGNVRGTSGQLTRVPLCNGGRGGGGSIAPKVTAPECPTIVVSCRMQWCGTPPPPKNSGLWHMCTSITAVSQHCRGHRTVCPMNTPVRTVFFKDQILHWTRGMGGTVKK